MNVARLLYPVKTLGPGNRVGIWFCGCHRGCKGCSNPELWDTRKEYQISVANLISVIRRLNSDHEIDGFTITGGEPLNQAKELSELLDCLRMISKDILIYTGYTLEEIYDANDSAKLDCVRKTAVIVDGPYIEEKNAGYRMVGSGNQRIIIIDSSYEASYRDYLSDGQLEVQNFVGSHGVYSIGIHRNDFTDDLIMHLRNEEDPDHE